MTTIGILHHLGLGDHIMLNGLVRHYAETFKVVVFILQNQKDSIEFMYKDLLNVSCFILKNNISSDFRTDIQNLCIPILQLATYSIPEPIWVQLTHGEHAISNWAHLPYTQAKVNPEYMRTKFYINRNFDRENCLFEQLGLKNKEYIFVHNHNVESKYFIFKPDNTINPFNIFDYIKVLENAKEIHCVNSSWAWVVELVKIGSNKTNFLKCLLAHDYYPPSTVKTVFTDTRWTFI